MSKDSINSLDDKIKALKLKRHSLLADKARDSLKVDGFKLVSRSQSKETWERNEDTDTHYQASVYTIYLHPSDSPLRYEELDDEYKYYSVISPRGWRSISRLAVSQFSREKKDAFDARYGNAS